MKTKSRRPTARPEGEAQDGLPVLERDDLAHAEGGDGADEGPQAEQAEIIHPRALP